MKRRQLSYQRAVQIVEQYQEVPRERAEQIQLLRMAGYTRIKGRSFTELPDRQLFRIAENTRARAERSISDYLINEDAEAERYRQNSLIDEAAKDQFKRWYALFGFDPHSEYAPDPEELEELLER